jgi:PAS domain S-box-containing protein
MILTALINNITLIVALSIFYSLIARRWPSETKPHRILSGLLFGTVAVVGMLNPFVFTPGLIFDGRSIIIGIAGFIGGWPTALIAALMGIACRIWLGGMGTVMGVSVITASATIGIAYHHLRRRHPETASPLHLLGFGIVVHLVMLLLTLTLPSGMPLDVLTQIAIPVLLVYPLGTLLICLVLLEQESLISATRELQASEERFKDLADLLPQCVFETDGQGRIIYANRRAFEAFGYAREDLERGVNVLQMVAPEDRPRVAEATGRILAGQPPLGRPEYLALRKDGTVFPVEIYSAPILAQGRATGLRGTIIDMTEKRRAEEEKRQLEERLRRSEKMEALGQLAGGVAHDMNNVLGVLVGYAELLQEKIPAADPRRRYAETIFQSGLKGAAIIQDLLTLARRGVAITAIVNLNQVVADYLKSPEFENLRDFHPQVTFASELAEGLLPIHGSPVHLHKTVMNLIANAAEAIPLAGRVTIRTENRYLDRPVQGYDDMQEGDYAILTVTDTGRGISPADIEKIFEPFYTKKVMGRSGTGLGLAVVWGTVKDHRGYIDVRSREERGSSFTLYFPASREAPDREREVLPAEKFPGRGETILVIDDVPEQRELAESMLTGLGYRVSTVAGGEEALAVLQTRRFDLLVLDMIMDPGMDGLDTYRRISEIYPGQKAVIVSGFSETDRVREAQRLGAGSYVKKPYVRERIGAAVRDALAKTEADPS